MVQGYLKKVVEVQIDGAPEISHSEKTRVVINLRYVFIRQSFIQPVRKEVCCRLSVHESGAEWGRYCLSD